MSWLLELLIENVVSGLGMAIGELLVTRAGKRFRRWLKRRKQKTSAKPDTASENRS